MNINFDTDNMNIIPGHGDTVRLWDFLSPAQKDDVANRTGAVDCLPALNEAIEAMQEQGPFVYPVSGRVELPRGLVFLDGELTLETSVHLFGHGSGMRGGNWATSLKFPSGTSGIVTTKGVAGVRNGSDGSVLQGMLLIGGGGAAAHGIDMKSRTLVKECGVTGFSGNGVNIVADSTSGTNANGWKIDGLATYENGGHGVYVHGGDSNAGQADGIDASGNGGWGVYDSSFLGNTYVGCQAESNGLGAYKSDNANARNLFLGCYSEGGQPASEIMFPAMVVGGLHGAEFTGGSTGLRFTDRKFNAMVSENTTTGAHIEVGPGPYEGGDASAVLALVDVTEFPYRLHYSTGKWYLDWANLGAAQYLHLYNRDTTVANGFTRNLGGAAQFNMGGIGFPSGFFGKGMVYRGESDAVPTSGEWLRGDIIFNSSPSANGHIGWVCTSSGSPGTWKQWGEIDS